VAVIAPREFRIVLLLCLVAALHVFVFAAALPFFNPVDEPAQFDLVLRYSRADIPHSAGPLNAETLRYIRYYGTLEYLWDENSLPQRKFPPPPWKLPSLAPAEDLAAAKQKIWPVLLDNYEAAQPPLYYVVAAAWWRFGQSLHLAEPALLFWLRFMNVFVVIVIVWLAYAAARLLFPKNLFVRLGVPALAAVFPQSAFYTVQNDIFSPLCCGAAFILIIKWVQTEIPTVPLGAAAGFALAATFLTKISNLPFLLISAAFVGWHVWQLARRGKLDPVTQSLVAVIISSGLPIALWLIHTKAAFGDFTGLHTKMRILTWTIKPFPMWWHHPIFTVEGSWKFVASLLSRFWQGEMVWHSEKLGFPAADLAYVILTFILLGASAVALCQSWLSKAQKHALWFGLATFLAGILFLGGLSLIFDFHYCVYPSRERPYFTSGRLILGALIPFLLLFMLGLDHCLHFTTTTIRFASLGLLTVTIPLVEVARNWPIFLSQYNWFHL
jgi:hypothetical protein